MRSPVFYLFVILIAFNVLEIQDIIRNGVSTHPFWSFHLNNSAGAVLETGLKHLRIREQLAFNKLNYLVAWHRSSCRE